MSRGKKDSPRKPDLFGYHDYRQFLKDWVEYRHEADSKISLRYLASQAGLSCAYLPSVLNGKRRLTKKAMALLQPHLGLPAREWEVFQLMVEAVDGASHTERGEALAQLQRLKGYQKANPKEAEAFRYLTKWFYVAIRELASTKDFNPDPDAIRRRLRGGLTRAQVEQAMEFLKEGGFLRHSGEVLEPAEKDLRCVGQVFRAALREFHHQMLAVVLDSLDHTPVDSHLILGHTMSIAEKDFSKVKEILEGALKRVEAFSRKEEGTDSVYHVGLMAAPLTNRGGEDQ